VITNEEKQVRHRVLKRFRIPGGGFELVDGMSADPAVDVGVHIGISPSKIGLENVARHLMRPYPSLGILHDREVPQPIPQRRDLLGIGVS
jgi:hypothetical protein